MSTRSIFVENYEGITPVLTAASTVVISGSNSSVYTYDISALDDDTVYEFVFKITRTNGDIEYVAGEIPIFTPVTGTAYETVTEAQSYFDNRLDVDAWTDATSSDKSTSLIQATKMIDKLNFKGEMAVSTQALQFPRDDDTVVPQDIKDACSEIALALLDGVDPELEFENLRMVSQGYANVRSTYDKDSPPQHFVAGIPSVTAWRYLKPYLRDVHAVDLSRVS